MVMVTEDPGIQFLNAVGEKHFMMLRNVSERSLFSQDTS